MDNLMHLNTVGAFSQHYHKETDAPQLSLMILGGTAEHGQMVSPVSSDVEQERTDAMAAWKQYQKKYTYQRLSKNEQKRQYGEFLVHNVLQDSSAEQNNDLIEVMNDRNNYGSISEKSLGFLEDDEINQQIRQKAEGSNDYLVEAQIQKKMEWLREAKKIKRDKERKEWEKIGMKRMADILQKPEEEEETVIRTDVEKGGEQYKMFFKLTNPAGKAQVISSLTHLDHWVLIIEDGKDLSTCNAIKANIPRFLEKYDFQIQQNELDLYQKMTFKLTQEDFEERALLEVLDYASNKLQQKVHIAYRKYYNSLFELSGRRITSLRQLSTDTKLLIVGTGKHFKGLYVDTEQQKTSIHDYQAYDKSSYKNSLATKRKVRVATQWYKDNLFKQWRDRDESQERLQDQMAKSAEALIVRDEQNDQSVSIIHKLKRKVTEYTNTDVQSINSITPRQAQMNRSASAMNQTQTTESNFITQQVPIEIHEDGKKTLSKKPKFFMGPGGSTELQSKTLYSGFNMNLEQQTQLYIQWKKEHRFDHQNIQMSATCPTLTANTTPKKRKNLIANDYLTPHNAYDDTEHKLQSPSSRANLQVLKLSVGRLHNIQTVDQSSSQSAICLTQQAIPTTANSNINRRRIPQIRNLSRLKSTQQSRNSNIAQSKTTYTGRTQDTVPKLYQALVKQSDTQINSRNAQKVMHQSHLPPKSTMNFHEVEKAISDFENSQLKTQSHQAWLAKILQTKVNPSIPKKNNPSALLLTKKSAQKLTKQKQNSKETEDLFDQTYLSRNANRPWDVLLSQTQYVDDRKESHSQTAQRHQNAVKALLNKGTPLMSLATKLEFNKHISMLKRKEVDGKLLQHTQMLAKQEDVHQAIQEAKSILKKKQDAAKLAVSKQQQFETHVASLDKVDLITNEFVERADQLSQTNSRRSEITSVHSFGTKQKRVFSHLQAQSRLTGIAKKRLGGIGYRQHHSLKQKSEQIINSFVVDQNNRRPTLEQQKEAKEQAKAYSNLHYAKMRAKNITEQRDYYQQKLKKVDANFTFRKKINQGKSTPQLSNGKNNESSLSSHKSRLLKPFQKYFDEHNLNLSSQRSYMNRSPFEQQRPPAHSLKQELLRDYKKIEDAKKELLDGKHLLTLDTDIATSQVSKQ